ncbi:hypothetical protein TYRP_002301 [Tyrophagus putrescentiae]|nr:hypothetical protein TYRP_002301 [Tyrophagus putrescentiae]
MTETPTSSSSSSSSSSSPLNTAASTSAAKSPLEELINNRIVRSYSEEFMSSSEERERGLQFFGSTGGSSAAVGGYSSLSAGGGVSPVHRHRIAPYFDTEEMNTNVTISEGSALVHLPCRVKQLGERTLSWIRKKDLQILTVGKYSYASDLRFNCKHMEGSDDWSLEISYPQKTDAGVYECQVATMPKMSQFVQLNVVVSKAKILEGPTLYLSSGSTLNLTCLVRDTPEPPDFIFWYFNGRVINYGSPRGIKVHTEKSTQTISRLTIAKAQPNDSGNYSCTPSNAEPAHIAVHINNNANPAASIQHGKRSAREFGTSGSGGGGSAHLALTTTVAACLATTIIQSAINNYYLQSQLWRRWRQPFPSLLSLPVYT